MEISINILSPVSLTSHKEGHDILGCLTDVSPLLIPDKCGYGEPIREEFDKDDIDSALMHWGQGFLWKRSKPRLQGGVWPAIGVRPTHGWIILRVSNRSLQESLLVRLMESWSTTLDADLSTIHLRSLGEIALGYDGLITGHDIRKNIPRLYWATAFGKPYLKLFGRDRLLDCPAHSIRELSNGSIFIQLTPSIFDIENDPDGFNKIRDVAKAHLNCNAFYSPELPDGHVYNVPEFVMRP